MFELPESHVNKGCDSYFRIIQEEQSQKHFRRFREARTAGFCVALSIHFHRMFDFPPFPQGGTI